MDDFDLVRSRISPARVASALGAEELSPYPATRVAISVRRSAVACRGF